MHRPRWSTGTLLTIVLICGSAPLATAGAQRVDQRVLGGKTSQGMRIQYVMHRVADGWGVQQLNVELHLRCPDGQSIYLFTGGGWTRPRALGPHNSVSIDRSDRYEALHVHGRIGPRGGSGTIEAKLPGLTADEQPQVCTSKSRSWTVQRRVPPLAPMCCSTAVDGRGAAISIMFGDGTQDISRTTSSGETSRSRHPIATHRYEGSTSQDLPLKLTTRNFGGPWRLADADLVFQMSCQQGPGFKFYFDIGWGGGGGARLSPSGRFAVDEVDLEDGLHIHGRLGGRAGSGTVAETEAELTRDEQAMLCSSRTRDWTVKRR